MRIDWTAQALAELEAIKQHIAQDSPQAAQAMVRRLIECCEQLTILPRGAPILPRYGRDDLRMLYEQPYRIVYQIYADRIEIVTLWHYRQSEPHPMVY
jgi:plasmid stabilization system protein ParE